MEHKAKNEATNSGQSISTQCANNFLDVSQTLACVSFCPVSPGKVYMIKMDPQNDKIIPVENDRFDPQRLEVAKANLAKEV